MESLVDKDGVFFIRHMEISRESLMELGGFDIFTNGIKGRRFHGQRCVTDLLFSVLDMIDLFFIRIFHLPSPLVAIGS